MANSETCKENSVSKKEVGLMTRDKDTESHQHIAAEQEVKIAEKAREHQVDIEDEVEEKKAAELKKRFLEEQQHKTDDVWKGCDTKTRGGAANSDRSLKKPGRMKGRKPKNENMRWRLRTRSLQEAQSAAEVAVREEQIAHNKESMAQVAAEEDATRIAGAEGPQQRTPKRSSSLSKSIMSRSQRSDRQHRKPRTTRILRSRVVHPRTHSTT